MSMVYSKDPISFFCMRISSFPNTIVEDYPFPIVNYLHPCQRSVDYVRMSSFLSSLFCARVCMSVFMLVTYCFNYCIFELYFVIRKCDASSFVLPQDCFGYCGPLWFLMNFRIHIFFYFCKKIMPLSYLSLIV